MRVKSVRGDELLLEIDEFLSPDEAADLVRIANATQTGVDDPLDKAWHVPDNGASYMRVTKRLESVAVDWYSRLEPHLPDTINGFKPLYCNPVFRFSRYRKGGRFNIHHDRPTKYDNSRPDLSEGYGAESIMTINVFLSAGYKDGGTTFYHGSLYDHKKKFVPKVRHTIVPEVGRAGVFWFDQPHTGDIVGEGGEKLLARTDIMGIRV